MYKKFKLLVVLIFLSAGGLKAQNIQLLMSPKPSPYISDWQQRTETVKLLIINSSTKDIQVKIKTELFDGKGTLVANTDAAKMPVLTVPPGSSTYNPEDIIPSNVVNYKGNLEKSAITTGRIPDDNYRICVALIDPVTGAPVGTSGTVCKTFSIMAYQAPTLVNPKDKEAISESGMKGIVFRWTPVTPAPSTIVTYRLQVWEVLEGQNSMTALRSNQPIVEKDLKGVLQTQWPVEFAMPEMGKNYVWTVTPLDDQGRKLVDGLGFAQPFAFSMQTQYIIQLDSLKVKCTYTPGLYTYSYIITNLNNTVAEFTNISITTSTPGGATIASTVPNPVVSIAASGGILLVSGTITASSSLSYICIKTRIQKQGDPNKNAEDYLCDTVKPCRCADCDDKHFTLTANAPAQINYTNNILSYSQSVSITTAPPKTIKNIKAELVYFEMTPENNFCIPCNKDAATYGHFTNGTNSLAWNTGNNPPPLNINITTPQLTPCCSAVFRWCIRYKIEFTDCTTCNKLVCYEKKKEGCNDQIDHDPLNKNIK